jgi:hypothetical protein
MVSKDNQDNINPVNIKQCYRGDKNIPTPDAEYNYTPAMVKEIKKCKESIIHFAENHFYITNLDRGKEKIELYTAQKRVLRSLMNNRFVCLLSSRQAGKALDVDTPILTDKGWEKIGDLKNGDFVYGIDGKKTRVVKAHDILYKRDCYEVEFDNGEKIVADGDHLWFTQSRSERKKTKGSVKTTKDILSNLKTYSGAPNHRIPICISGIENSTKLLPIDPYTLGLWLGDETNTSIRLSCKTLKKSESLTSIIKENKHIPSEYFLSSREQRLELLKGLIDSDGYVRHDGGTYFYNTNLELVQQVRTLIEGLGYKVTYKDFILKPNGVECTRCGMITFQPRELVCTLPSKTKRIKVEPQVHNSKKRGHYHYIKNITAVKSRPVRCISVDNEDNLYLAGKQLIPTHNSTIMTIYALWLACFYSDQRIVIVANKEKTATNIFGRVRMAYEQLPGYIKPGVKEYQKTGVIFANDSSIGVSTTTSTAVRGESINCLICDELAFVECVTGDSLIEVRNKKNKEIKKITIRNFMELLSVNSNREGF